VWGKEMERKDCEWGPHGWRRPGTGYQDKWHLKGPESIPSPRKTGEMNYNPIVVSHEQITAGRIYIILFTIPEDKMTRS